MPRKEVFRKEEWVFFLDEEGNLRYNEKCLGCRRTCKQSFRAIIMYCPIYEPVGGKTHEK